MTGEIVVLNAVSVIVMRKFSLIKLPGFVSEEQSGSLNSSVESCVILESLPCLKCCVRFAAAKKSLYFA